MKACFVFALLTPLAATCWASSAYDFAYASSGEPELRPLQVFDDGTYSYFQFRSQLLQPTVTASVDGKTRLLIPQRMGPYLRIELIANRYAIGFGALQAAVAYAGPERPVSKSYIPPPAVALIPLAAARESSKQSVAPTFGAAKPVQGDSSDTPYLQKDALIAFANGKSTLSKQAAAQVLAALPGGMVVDKIVITGRDDAGNGDSLAKARAMAIRDRFLSAGVSLEKIVTKEAAGNDPQEGAHPSEISVIWAAAKRSQSPSRASTEEPATRVDSAPPIRQAVWEIRQSDRTLEQTLHRWAAESGWKLIWMEAPSIPISGNTELDRPDFLRAADFLIAQVRAAGHRLKATAYNNQTLVVTKEDSK